MQIVAMTEDRALGAPRCTTGEQNDKRIVFVDGRRWHLGLRAAQDRGQFLQVTTRQTREPAFDALEAARITEQ